MPQIDTVCFGTSHHPHSWGQPFFWCKASRRVKKTGTIKQTPDMLQRSMVTVSQQNLVSLFSLFLSPFQYPAGIYMAVSKNRGTPKSSILIGFSIINHPFWGTILGNPHIFPPHYPLNPLHRNSHPPIALELRNPPTVCYSRAVVLPMVVTSVRGEFSLIQLITRKLYAKVQGSKHQSIHFPTQKQTSEVGENLSTPRSLRHVTHPPIHPRFSGEIYHNITELVSAQELVDCVGNPHHCGGSGGCNGATTELAMAYVSWNRQKGGGFGVSTMMRKETSSQC